MPDVTEEEIKRALELAEKASEGPWTCEPNETAEVWMIGHKHDHNFASVYIDRTGDTQPGVDAAYIAFANPAFVKRLASELLSLRKSSHSVSQCCPMSERLQKRVEELEAIVSQLPKTKDGKPITPGMEIWRSNSYDKTDISRDTARMYAKSANFEQYGVFDGSHYSTRELAEAALAERAAAEASAKGVK